MSKTTMAVIAVVVVLAVVAVSCIMYGISISNSEVKQRNLIIAKQKDNQNEFDNVVKKIGQTAQVSQEQMKSIKEIIVGQASARTTGGGGLMKFVHETVPNLDQSTQTFRDLVNVIAASRDAFTMRQKELLDLKRAHDNMIDTFPSSLIVGSRGKIEVVVVTSTRAEEAFKSAKDDDTSVFPK